jgi:hypothetical protein
LTTERHEDTGFLLLVSQLSLKEGLTLLVYEALSYKCFLLLVSQLSPKEGLTLLVYEALSYKCFLLLVSQLSPKEDDTDSCLVHKRFVYLIPSPPPLSQRDTPTTLHSIVYLIKYMSLYTSIRSLLGAVSNTSSLRPHTLVASGLIHL